MKASKNRAAFDVQGRMYALEVGRAKNKTPIPGTGRVVRVTTSPSGSGSATVQEIATGLMFPTSLTYGPDGNLYVTNNGFGFTPRARAKSSASLFPIDKSHWSKHMAHANIELVRKYFAALAKGDMPAAGALFADDIVWHQPGKSALSRSYRGKGEIFPLLGRFMEISKGTFQIDEVHSVMVNGNHVAATVHFRAQHGRNKLSMDGVDLMRVEDGLIREVWLFSADQAAEDKFWDEAASAVHA